MFPGRKEGGPLMWILEGQNLVLVGFVLALLFGVLASVAMLYQMKQVQRAERREAEVRDLHFTLRRDVEAVTQAMTEGLYLLRLENNQIVVDRNYSAAVEIPANDAQNPLDQLLNASELSKEERADIHRILTASFGITILQWDFNAKTLPKELRVDMDRKVKILSLKWKAIRTTEGLVAKIVLLTVDITELRNHEEDARTRYDDAKRLMELIGNSPKKIGEYFAIIESMLDDAKNNNQTATITPSLHFRNIHTLKGMARGYQLEELSRCLHELEDALEEDPEAVKSLQHLPAFITCESSFRAYRRLFLKVYTQKLANAQVSADPKLMLGLTDQIETAVIRSDLRSIVESLNEIRSIFACTLDKIIIDEIGMIKKLAEDLGKPTPELYINELDLQVSEETKVLLRKVFVHLFRNSLDHGIETEARRHSAGKSLKGSITIQSSLENDSYRIRYFDDGNGLNLDSIREKASQLGIIDRNENLTEQALAELIFEAGLSTASRGSSFSGRGVGMDAVRSFLRQGGGHISIQLEKNQEGKGRPFSFLIEIPRENKASKPLQKAG